MNVQKVCKTANQIFDLAFFIAVQISSESAFTFYETNTYYEIKPSQKSECWLEFLERPDLISCI